MCLYAGFDVGGTKIAVVLGYDQGNSVEIIAREQFDTPCGYPAAKENMLSLLKKMLAERGLTLQQLRGVGISCGGPLDGKKGLVLSPPHLPGWDAVPIVEDLRADLGVPVYLQNDADACALAEWRFGAGQGMENMIFLTCGTGFGAGLILGGRLYTGTGNMAGEIGHIRSSHTSPVVLEGYGKKDVYEAYCSGSGIGQIACALAVQAIEEGKPASYCPTLDDLPFVNARSAAEAARKGDDVALKAFDLASRHLGAALSMLVDLLNPQGIVLGSVYARCEDLLCEKVQRILQQECLSISMRNVKILPAKLGEKLGDIAALSIAIAGNE